MRHTYHMTAEGGAEPARRSAWRVLVAAAGYGRAARSGTLSIAVACLAAAALAPQGESSAQAPRAEQGRARPAAAGQPAAGEAPAAPLRLPAGFRPPGEIPEIMTVEDELLTEQEDDALYQELRRSQYTGVLRAGVLNAQTRPVLEKAAQWRVHRLSMKKYRDRIQDERAALTREITGAASLQQNEQVAQQFREFYLRQVMARCEELLGGNFLVRLNAVLIISELNLTEPRDGVPRAFTEAWEPLVKVLADPDQHDGIKIAAARGVERICLHGQPRPSSEQRHRIANTLIAELNRPGADKWYQQRLAQALGGADVALDLQQRPFIADALAKIVVDQDRWCGVRCEAARSLGRIPLDTNVNVSLLAFEIARLAHQLAEEYDRDPKAAHWPGCYFNLYLAFRPLDAAARQRGDGLMTKCERGAHAGHRTAVQQAYEQVVPLARHTLARPGQPFEKALLDRTAEWIKSNPPGSFQVAPNLQPITSQQAAAPDSKPAG